MSRYLLAFIFCFIYNFLSAQNFGGFPPSTKWKQIDTDTARIIFDAATRNQAERIATLIHKMAQQRPISIGNELRKINVVLHKNTTLANGYLALAPFRSEFYLIPSSNVFDQGNIPWHEHLTIHEYRHVQQYNNFNKGLTKVFRFVLGEEGQALANAATIPNWFFEGDAVHSETALTPQGRGRLPLFLSGYNSLWQEGKNYSLMKLLNGSLKDYVPSHYQLGYLFVNYGYQKYGADFWQKVTGDAALFKGLFYPFNKAVQRYSGLRYRQFQRTALNNYSEKVKLNEKEKPVRPAVVSNFYFPQFIGQDSLLYFKESYKKIPAFYIQSKGVEKRVKLRNISSEDWLSYKNGLIAYTAYGTNARWSLTDYSDIILLNIHTGREKKLTRKGKYYTPSFSPSGNAIIAVFINDSLQSELHLLSAEDGKLQRKIRANGNFYVNPILPDEENIVTGIRKEDGSIALHRINFSTGNTQQLTPSSFHVLGYPSIQHDTLLFTAAYNGNDDLYALNLTDLKIYQLTQQQTGSYYVQAKGDSIVWSQFTADGLRVRKEAKNKLLWKEWKAQEIKEPNANFPVALEGTNILTTPTRSFNNSRYKKGTGLFNFHSWRPFYEDPEFTFSLYGNNVLNTLTSEIFYRYNQNEQSHGGGVNFNYSAFFPVLTASAEYTFNRHITIRTPQGLRSGLLNAYELRGGYYIPLNFTQGNTYKTLTFGSSYNFNKQMPVGSTKNLLRSFYSSYLNHFINWSQQLPRARQQIFPKFGYALSGSYRHRLDEGGYQSLGTGQLYLPSFKNQSIVLSGSYQQVDTSNVLFTNRFTNSRGYSELYFSKMWRTSANYHFPIAYPDWGFANLVYFLRIRGNAFYDFTKVYSKDKQATANMRSTGAELFFDTKWWNQLPVTIGLRYSYLLDADRFGANKHSFEIVIPTSLIPD